MGVPEPNATDHQHALCVRLLRVCGIDMALLLQNEQTALYHSFVCVD